MTQNVKEKINICPICGSEFTPSVERKKYCSKECRHKAKIEAQKEKRKTEKYKEIMKNYVKSDKYKEVNRRYMESEKGKQAVYRYIHSEKGKAKRKQYYEEKIKVKLPKNKFRQSF